MSLTVRLIPCLDVDNGRVVKGVQFVDIKDAGDPVELASLYDSQGADELVLLDITASVEGRDTIVDLAQQCAKELSIPFTIGGGVRSVEDGRRLLLGGADKVGVNSAAVKRPELISELRDAFGGQAVVGAVDVKREKEGYWQVYISGGRTPTGLDAIEWVKELEGLGAGELLVTSMDRDGSKSGYDLELLKAIKGVTNLPVIASGGAGSIQDIIDAVLIGGVDAVLVASLLHFGEVTIEEIKAGMADAGISVRTLKEYE